MKSLTSKYPPKDIEDITGQDKGVAKLKDFVLGFNKRKKKRAAIIYGAAGCGKTCSVHALASSLGLEIIELNASDLRNKEQINSIVGAASRQSSLFSSGKIILLDEIDGIAGRADFGGIGEVIRIMGESCFPIVITANNPFDNKFSSLRSKSELIEFKALDADSVTIILKKICINEKLKCDEEILRRIARRNSGDARSAINDLQIIFSDKKKITKEDADNLSERDRTESIMNALVKVLKSTEPSIALGAFDNINEDLDECVLWIDENLPKEYKNPQELANAYDVLSRADVFRGRISRQQHWRFQSYINELLTAGIATAKCEKKSGFVQYSRTGRILKLWWAKQKNMKKKEIAKKIAFKTHCSAKEAFKNIEYFKIIFQKEKRFAKKAADEFKLEKEEIEWLKK